MTRFVNIDGTYHNVSEIKKFYTTPGGNAKVIFRDGGELELDRAELPDDILGYGYGKRPVQVLVDISDSLESISQNLARCISRSGEGGFLCVTGNIDTSN